MFTFNKAIVAAILGLLAPVGITGEMSVETALTSVVTSIIAFVVVYMTKNKVK